MNNFKKVLSLIFVFIFSLSTLCVSGCDLFNKKPDRPLEWWEYPETKVFLVEHGDFVIEKDTNVVHGISLQGSAKTDIVVPEQINGKIPMIPTEYARYVNTNAEVSCKSFKNIKKIFLNYKTNQNFTQQDLITQALLWYKKSQVTYNVQMRLDYESKVQHVFENQGLKLYGGVFVNDSTLTEGGNKFFSNSCVAQNYIGENGLVYAGIIDWDSSFPYINFLLANVQFLYNYDGAPNQGYYWIDYCNLSKPYRPADPTREGYRFAGWYKDKEFTKALDFSQTITTSKLIGEGWQLSDYAYPDHYSSLKLYYPADYVCYIYAKWEKVV